MAVLFPSKSWCFNSLSGIMTTLIDKQEQFSKEWDYVDRYPSAHNAKVAGRFSYKSNLYNFGLVSLTSGSRLLSFS